MNNDIYVIYNGEFWEQTIRFVSFDLKKVIEYLKADDFRARCCTIQIWNESTLKRTCYADDLFEENKEIKDG